MTRRIFVATLVVTALVASGEMLAQENRPLVVASTTQVADFARQVVGDRMEVRSVLAPGADPHLYEVKPSDAELVRQAAICLENGMHLEGGDWMRKLAVAAGKEDELVTCTVGIKPIVLKAEGNQHVDDPHSWFTPLNAAVYVNNITQAVGKYDPQHKDEYQARARLYLEQLRALHLWIREQLSAIPPEQRILVTSHDAFNYYCQAYGFEARAPVGWSTGAEIGGGLTPARRKTVVDSIRDSGVQAIFVETSVNPKLIREIAKEAGVAIGGTLYSDSMGGPGTAGETYVGMMRENTLHIAGALKRK